jgi:hypothetical protein
MNTTTVKESRTRTPRSSESITAGALALPLAERVALKNKIDESIKSEVATLKQKAEDALKIMNEG